jgi:hypothetical protein
MPSWACNAERARTHHGQFHSSREGVFFYVMTTPSGISNACGIADASYYKPDNQGSGNLRFIYGNRAGTFAHEMGHYLGLQHWGQDTWGAVNGKPNYRSIMNYAMGLDPSLGFSLINSMSLHNRSVLESFGNGIHCSDLNPEYIVNNPFYLTLAPTYVPPPNCVGYVGVDWNRSSTISPASIRVPLLWNASRDSGGTTLFPADVTQNIPLANNATDTPPKIIRVNQRLYGFWVDPEQRKIRYRHGEIEKVSGGHGIFGSCQKHTSSNQQAPSCPPQAAPDDVRCLSPDNMKSTKCLDWQPNPSSVAKVIEGIENIDNFSVIWNNTTGWDDSKVTLAYQIAGQIFLREASVLSDGTLSLLPLIVHISDVFLGINLTERERAGIELSWIRVNPSLTLPGQSTSTFQQQPVVLALFYLDEQGYHKWSTKNIQTGSWTARGRVSFEDVPGNPYEIKTRFSASLVNIPHLDTPDAKTCMLASSGTRNIAGYPLVTTFGLFCLDKTASDLRWVYIKSFKYFGEPPFGTQTDTQRNATSSRKPSIIFHTPRLTEGAEEIANKGYFIVTFAGHLGFLFNSSSTDVFSRISKTITANDLDFYKYWTDEKPFLFHDFSIPYLSSPSFSYHQAILYEDQELAATKGIALDQSNQQIKFIPFADGTYQISGGIRSGDDFEVMGRYLCYNLQRTTTWPCHPCIQQSDCPVGTACLQNGTCR